MSRKVKLDAFTIRIKKRNTRDTYVGFDEFFQVPNGSGELEDHSFVDFFKSYIRSFGNALDNTENPNQALHIPSDEGVIKIRRLQRVIYGTIEGGSTGYGFQLIDRNNVGSRQSVDPDKVSANSFHFLLWIPDDWKTGFLLVQGYSDASISTLLRQHLARFIKNNCPEYTLETNRSYDPTVIDYFRENATIDKVILRKSKISSDISDSTTFISDAVSGTLNIDIQITGISSNPSLMQRIFGYIEGGDEIIEFDDLVSPDVNGRSDTIIEYKIDGRVAKAYASKGFDIFPDLYIDLPLDTNGHVDPTNTFDFLLSYLELVKTRVRYTALRDQDV